MNRANSAEIFSKRN